MKKRMNVYSSEAWLGLKNGGGGGVRTNQTSSNEENRILVDS